MGTDFPLSTSAYSRNTQPEGEASPSETLVPFDHYEPRSPSAQNAIDAIPGWNSQFPQEFGIQAGNRLHFRDDRILWAIERFGAIKDTHVLELGPLEGAHTYVLDRAGAKITAIEANKLAYLKCLVTKEIVDLPNARFLLGDCVKYLEQNETRHDLIVACGVLYHMPDPLRFLEAVARRTNELYLWTSFVDLDGASSDNPAVRHFLRVRELRDFHGAAMMLYPRSYENAHANDDFCGGIYNEPHWMSRQSILDALSVLGFSSIEIAHEATPHPLESCLSIYARRR